MIEHTITVVEGANNCTARCTACEWWFTSSRKEMIEVAIKAHVEEERAEASTNL